MAARRHSTTSEVMSLVKCGFHAFAWHPASGCTRAVHLPDTAPEQGLAPNLEGEDEDEDSEDERRSRFSVCFFERLKLIGYRNNRAYGVAN